VARRAMFAATRAFAVSDAFADGMSFPFAAADE
jgi:hypothetical protein